MNRRHLLGIAALAVAAPVAGCRRGAEVRDPEPAPKTPLPAGMVMLQGGDNVAQLPRETGAKPATDKAGCAFAGALARALAGKKDLLVSPISLSLPLAMLANGARGATLKDLLGALGYASIDELNTACNNLQQTLTGRNRKVEAGRRKGEVGLQIADALWAQQATPIKQDFLDRAARWYGAGMHGVDFGDAQNTANTINGWAASNTHDRIKNLLSPDAINEMTRLVLTNAIWFKAPWADEFFRDGQRPFTRDDGSTTHPETITPFTNSWAQGPGWRAAALNYLGNELAMAFVLPDAGKESAMLDGWAKGGLHGLLTGWQDAEVRLTVPLWKHEQDLKLIEALGKLGITHLFEGQQVDLGGIRDPKVEQLFVSEVVQKTWIAVDEQGTEAAAATAVVVEATSGPAPRRMQELTLDRPFWYVIFDRVTATPLFVGRVADPVY
ncbi:serpin family protein [Luteococcus sp. H138]|uniref:serpin family protein n=1 Tax=unclassified Luteococcus TaxID=2639923 RepID=UPI00313BB4B1